MDSFWLDIISSVNQSTDLQGPDEIVEKSLWSSDGSSVCEDFVSLVQTWLNKFKVQ